MKFHIILICLFVPWLSVKETKAQSVNDSAWTLQRCIDYALQQNIQVRKMGLSTDLNQVYNEQAKAARFPSLSVSANQNFSWSKSPGADGQYGEYSGKNGSGYAVTSGMILYNGGKIRKNIQQTELTYQASQYDSDSPKVSISLSILDAYLQVLYAGEQVKNSQQQVETTTEQLRLAMERVRLGAISRSEYLQVKSQLASEKLTLAEAENLMTLNKVNLMQLLELPVSADFSIVTPVFGDSIDQKRNPQPEVVFNIALGIKPQIKSAELNRQIAQLEADVAKADQMPSLSLNGEVSTGYSNSYSGISYPDQMENRITPSAGLTLSLPIFKNKQIRSNISVAKIGIQTAELNISDTKNQLRKAIEQACTDVTSAEKKYDASMESYKAAEESHQVAAEKFNQGLLSSVDYLIQKTNLIVAQSSLLQAKYNLIFSYKFLDFYTGLPLTL